METEPGFCLALLGSDGGKCRDQLVHILAAAVRTGDAALFGFRNVQRLSKLFVAICAMKDVLRHGGLPRTHLNAESGRVGQAGRRLR